MATSGSVFAKQFAGRIRQVGRDGDLSQAPAVSKASVGGVGSAKGQISAPPAKQKAASVGVHAVKAKAKAAQSKASPAAVDNEEEDGDDNGGVMTCANRGLLQQMLMKANASDERHDIGSKGSAGSDDEKDEALSMSMRLVPGTPKAGTRIFSNVPTLTSPSSKRMGADLGSQRAVSSVAPPSLQAKSTSSTSAPNLQSKVKPVSATGPPAKSGMPVPVPKVVTSAPRQQNVAPAPPRPGSRAGLTGGNPPVQTIVSPSHQTIGNRVSVSTPLSRASGSYSGIHATRAKASPGVRLNSPLTKAKGMPPGRPLCGPAAFDMLAKLENSQTLNCEGDDNGGSDDSGDEGGFIMPDGSEASSLDGDQQTRLAEVDAIDPSIGRSRPAPGENSKSSNAKGSTDVKKDRKASNEAVESAADYVERVKRSMGVPTAAADVDENSKCVVEAVVPNEKIETPPTSSVEATTRSREQAVPKQGSRARSSDSRSRAATSKASPPSSAVRAHSSDTKSRHEERRPETTSPEEDSDDDDDLPASNSVQWKFDLKSMVKDFAREERARQGGNGPQKPSVKPQAPSRPPKAPPHGNAPPQVNPDKPSTSALEQVPPGEQLFFSKKPREVDYTPATMDEYKQKGYGKKEYTELKPTLGPDLDDEELLHKKAIQERKKEFSKELQRVNKQRIEAASKQAPKADSRSEPKPTARSKAQEYVKNVPKPKATIAKPPPERKPKEASSHHTPQADNKKEDLADWEEIRRREKQHFADVLRVKDIKDFLGQLNY